MKIVQITRIYENLGGIAQVAINYHNAVKIADQNITCKTIIDLHSPIKPELPEDEDFIIRHKITKTISQFKILFSSEIRHIIKNCDICILHTSTCISAIKIIRSIYNKKFIIVGVGHNNSRIKKASRFDHIICLNEQQQEKIIGHFTHQSTSILHNPLSSMPYNLDLIHNKIIEQESRSNDISILMISNLIEKKNIIRAIYEFEYLVNNNPEVKNCNLYIAGNGPLKQSLHDIVCKLSLDKRIHFLGWINPEKKEELFMNCNFFWHTSLIEPFGIVLIESILFGCNVISLENEGAVSINKQTNAINLIPKTDELGTFARATIRINSSNNQVKLIKGVTSIKENYIITSFSKKFIQQMNDIYKIKH